uniref:EF-hand domain-containing protein n=1 Tax=Solanum tuberosum TaxID=4113 RepID=M1BX15_SOLTU
MFLSTRCRLIKEANQGRDRFVSVPELKQLFMKIRSRKLYRDKDYKTDEVIEEFDLDDDGMINMDEFVKGFTRWIDEIKDAMVGTLYTEDGKPNISAIKKCMVDPPKVVHFERSVTGATTFLDVDEKVDKIIKQFDVSGDEMIIVEEFVIGFSQCLHNVGHTGVQR